jgi:1-acyl-sn-glycerol-3-phosphate acyltransferase
MDRLIYDNGAYVSRPAKVPLLIRAWPSLGFYTRYARIIFRSSGNAKRGMYATADWASSSLEVMRALESVGVLFEITGVNSFVELDSPCVFIGNHMSTLETMVLPAIIAQFRDATFIVKKSLVDYPVFGHVMRSRDPITVTRTNAREDLKAVLEGGTERLARGRSIVVFPQTTRTDRFDRAEFNSIGVKLAKKAGVPVVPIALKTDAWANGRRFKDFGPIDPAKRVFFAFGEPLPVRDRGMEEHELIIAFIERKLAEWGAVRPEEPAGLTGGEETEESR